MSTPAAGRARRGNWIGAAAVSAVVAVVATLAVVWPGYDAQQTPLDDATVWAMQNGAGNGYARVNLELGELDTVKQVENGSALAQTDRRLFVFSDGGTQFADVDMATPPDLTTDDDDAFAATPPGTAEVAAAGDFLAYRTEAGAVYGATLSSAGRTTSIDPYAEVSVEEGQERPRFVATAVAVDADGILYAYSAEEGRVLRADAATGRILGDDTTARSPADAQLTAVGGAWALLDESTGDLQVRDRAEEVATGAGAGAVLQQASTDGTGVYVADAQGLVQVSLDSLTAARVHSDTALGTAVAPATLDGTVFAAWLPEGDAGGTLWSSDSGEAVDLDYAGTDIGEGLDPVFVGNGSRLALNERRSGWVWTVPDGQLVPSSQAWDLEEPTEVEQQNDVEAERVLDPKPPVAVDDAFGVRAGSVAVLPVLLNDHDPNEDVLSIDPASVEGLDPAFGTVSLAGAQQQLVLQVADDASGSATLRYRATDGTTTGGLLSDAATVTVTAVPDTQNSAPVWCGVDGCLATWPSPTVAPGGTVSVDVLDGWVDPEGDPIYLAGAVNDPATGGAVTAAPNGTVTYQHPDPNAAEAVTVTLGVTVSDARGATAERPLSIGVTPTPELVAESFAVVGVVGEPVAVDIAPYVSGSTGTLTLTKAVALDDARSTVTANATGLNMVFGATEPGSYLVQYTVRDDRGEVSGVVRVTMTGPDAATISTPPLTAFVRPNEDATVDVFPAVANPAGLVLLVSDIRPQSDALSSLSVDLVGQSMLRVSGTTDDGQPGRLGVVRYTVSDGTGSARTTAQGELTVILLPSPSADPPIAVDDAVTVRAGAQIDIPVLANDSAPAGALIAVDPSRVVNESDAGLAFASSRVLRYLAPREPGVYSLGYTVFRLGFPDVVDSARVVVTVIGDDTNQAPVPRTLEGRVLSGATVRIPFSSFEVDPDGDAVTLDRITTQPEQGSATIAAEGDAIVYTSPEAFSGQVRFGYQVRDAQGATGAAEVRVGVLDTQSDPSPVTYSDYIQIQAGETAAAVVRPGDNDVDPGGGELELMAVEPNAPRDSDEFTALQSRLGPIDDGQVTLRAGNELGTFSYSYTVRNDAGDTAMGLIVVKVVRAPVPDFPIVRDTSLTIESREAFPRGVDVLSGKVSWNAGDVSDLTLSLWGSHPGIEVDGWRISGAVPEETLLIPFEVSGTAFDGTEVSSYGFLRVPGDRDVQLSLRSSMSSLDVREKEHVDLDLAQAVAVPAGQQLVVGSGVRAGGARAEASCTLTSGTTVRYSAGTGAPWTDTCIVPVKLEIQDEYTFLTVRIDVEAEIPQPVLRSASIGVSPGTTVEYDLRDMVGWTGKEDWDAVQYAAAYRGDQFVVTQNGSRVTVAANDTARPGREESVAVTLPSHRDTPAASLILTVGPAPSTLPKGGSAVQRCSQTGGATSCTITVIGAAGEVNPLPRTPLTLVSATGPGNCAGVSFTRAGDTAVRASWAADAAGAADCTGSFVVQDAQGRQSAGDRNGQVILDLQGLPATPSRLNWTGFTATGVTLRVVSDAASYPAVEGYRITTGGRVVATCSASGECPAIEAPTGEQIAYEARAFNAVGESRGAVGTTAWAYRSPAAPTGATFTPTPNGNDGGIATITVTGIDTSAGSVRLTGGTGGEVTAPVRGDTAIFRDYVIGSNEPKTLTATPLTRFELPPIPGGSQTGGSYSFQAYGIGAPGMDLTVTPSTGGERTVTATARLTANGVGSDILVGFTTGGRCTPTQGVGAGGGTATQVFERQDLWREVTVTACAVTVRDGVRFGFTEATGTATPTSGIDAPTGRAQYTIDPEPTRSGSIYTWNRFTAVPDLDVDRAFTLVYRAGTAETQDFINLFALGTNPGGIQAFACIGVFGCSSPGVDITPTGAAYTAQASFPTTCLSGEGAPSASVTAQSADHDVAVSTATDAAGVDTHTYSLTWRGALTGLDDVTVTLPCAPPPPPAPAPVPTPPAPVPTPPPADPAP
ncbi:Ig-like domain-containing protein [Microbacterium sp. Sa4CUA7]|uniref:Ig-like domain-containing protein n=1 Tax=Microbacterium pullorum TaxID=2762236 RepID=A0ABR8S0E1_9MICO|nr:Ig-like domain-containing protein [Microbacterium pullorum]MBD7956940.1 Ig-like domain-containing protein [Microbacterium pullorum]